MLKKTQRFSAIFLCIFFTKNAFALTLTSGQTNFVTSGNITTSGVGISSTLVGTVSNLNKIKNLHIITTGNSGGTSSAYGIKTTGNYNQITNYLGATIQTTGSSGRGISVSNLSVVINSGSITTQGSSAYGIHGGGDNNVITNSGNIQTFGSSSYGINLDGNNNSASNSGSISVAQTYGIYISAGSGSTASALNYNSVNNSGNVTSGSNHAIYNKDNFTQITNSGTLVSADISSVYGVRNEGSNVTISNTGNINSNRYAIYNSGDDVIINNSGNLAGGLRLGNATLNILGGTISGEVEGSDAGSINIGSNSVSTNFTQSANFLNLTSLSVKAGSSFTSDRTIEASTIYLGANSNFTLENGVIFSGAIQGENSSSGNLNLSGIDFFAANGIANSSASLANLNIDSTSSLTSSNNIYANNIFLDGDLNFSNANNLTIAGNLTASTAAKIDIGSRSQIISGNFSLLSGATLATTLENNAIGNFTVGNLANIDEASKLALNFSSNNDYISDGTKFTIINAGNGSNISAINNDNIAINGNDSNIYGLLRFKTSSDATHLFLEANHLAAEEISQDENVKNIYRALNKIGDDSNGKLREFQKYIDGANLSSAQLNSTIKQLAPQSTKASLLTTSALVNNSLKIDERRLEKHHLQTEKGDGFFAEGFGNSLQQNEVKDDDGFSANSTGFAFGFDHEFSENKNAGISLSYAKSDVKTADDSKRNFINSYQLNIFSGQKFGDYFLDYVAGFAWHKYDSNRSITALKSNATAAYNGQTYAAKIKSGVIKNLPFELKIIPEFSLNFLHSKIGGYSERGADSLNLKVGGVAANFLEARIGTSFGWIGKIPEMHEFKKLVALVKISYGYNIINDRPQTLSSFASQDAVTLNSKISQMDSGSLKVGFEVDAFHIDDINFALEYSLEKRSSSQSHFILAKVRQEF